MMLFRTPKLYSKRTVRSFAFFPRKTDEGWVWLEKVLLEQTYFYYMGWTTTERYRLYEIL